MKQSKRTTPVTSDPFWRQSAAELTQSAAPGRPPALAAYGCWCSTTWQCSPSLCSRPRWCTPPESSCWRTRIPMTSRRPASRPRPSGRPWGRQSRPVCPWTVARRLELVINRQHAMIIEGFVMNWIRLWYMCEVQTLCMRKYYQSAQPSSSCVV